MTFLGSWKTTVKAQSTQYPTAGMEALLTGMAGKMSLWKEGD